MMRIANAGSVPRMKFTVAAAVVFVGLCYFSTSDAFCWKLIDDKINYKDAKTIVNQHNKLRLQIAKGKVSGQPRGKNLKKMSWDRKLAESAKRIALTCKNAHVQVSDKRFEVGQNIYFSKSFAKNREFNYTDAVNSWFDEHKTYIYNSGVYNHYTQVIWAKTTLVGCGHTYYHKLNMYYHLFVCNYGPAGNYVQQRPYKPGYGCTRLC